MAKQIHIQIPKPCHEKWSEMTATEQGAFCKVCSKNVTDFSRKTENEIYEIITGSMGQVCGRFNTFQLNHPIRKTELKNGFLNWRAIAAGVAAFFSLGKLAAGGDLENKPKTVCTAPADTAAAVSLCHPVQISYTTGIVNAGSFPKLIDTGVSGKVIDADTKEPVAHCTVLIKNTNLATVTDEEGNFILKTVPDSLKQGAKIVFQYLGYEPREFALKQFVNNLVVELEQKDFGLMGVIVVTQKPSLDFRDEFNNELIQRYEPDLDIRPSVRARNRRE